MKRILVLGYARKNVGDDLFISILLNRYRECEFLLRIDDEFYYEPFTKYSNCKMVLTKEDILKQDMTGIDACLYVGGSIFIEYDRSLAYRKNFNEFLSNCKRDNIPFCYVSSNFGPYKTQEFFDSCYEAFSIIEGITFRDKKSYSQFSDLDTVKYVPDMVFGLKFKKGKRIKDSIGISLVDLSLPVRGEAMNKADIHYTKMLAANIKRYIDRGKKVYLYSFCSHEGDVRTIDRILELLGNYKDKVNVVLYTGELNNLEEFIGIYSRMEKMICTRFHSVVLSLIFNHEVFVISYSNKINNLLDDLNQDIKKIDVLDVNEDLEILDDMFVRVDGKIIKKLSQNVSEHFKALDDKMGFKNLNNYFEI